MKEALASFSKIKSRVRVETIVKSVRKTKLRYHVPFGQGIDSKINNGIAKRTKEMVRRLKIKWSKRSFWEQESEKTARSGQKALRDNLIQLREPSIIVDELWRAAVKMSHKFIQPQNQCESRQQCLYDVIENEDAIEKLEKGV